MVTRKCQEGGNAVSFRLRKIRSRRVPVILGLLLLMGGGCDSTGKTGSPATLKPRGVPFIDDVPVPGGFTLVDKQTLKYESAGVRLAWQEYRGGSERHAVRRFYREQMPSYGWNLINDQEFKETITIRFTKKDEECTVSISPSGMFGQTSVEVKLCPIQRTPLEPPKRPLP